MTAYAKNRDLMREISMSKNSYSDNSPLWDYFDFISFSEKEAKSLAPKARKLKPGQVKKKLDSIENQLKDLSNPANYAHVEGLTALDISQAIEYLETRRSVINEHAKQDDYLVFRLVSYRHIPKKKNPYRKASRESEYHEFVPFPPYETAVLIDNQIHTKYRTFFKKNEFCVRGRPTNFLTCLQNLMVNRITKQDNWRGYPDIADWRQEIMIRLFEMGLKFNEASTKYPLNIIRNPNPFAYYTSAINNTLKNCVSAEKKFRNQETEIADWLRHELENELSLPAKPVKRSNRND